MIIPAFNEEESLAAVVEALRRGAPQWDVVVIDDGSRDATVRVARATGAKVLSLPFNLGIGGAVQTGYQYARDLGYDVAVQVDADGQHPPAELPKLLGPLVAGGADLVAGSRFLPGAGAYRAGPARRAGILYFAWLLSAVTGRRVTDPTSGFRAVNRRVIEVFASDYPPDYPEVDSLVLLHRRALRGIEVPVRMDPRQGGQSSISWARSMYYMVKVTLSVFVQLLRTRRDAP
ncbi:MAG: glycosyltransferase family 2 protein [Deferrisomatales bacterium]